MLKFYNFMWQLTDAEHRTDEQSTAQHELPVNWIRVCVFRELKEEWSDDSGGWRIAAVHTAMSLVEESVVVGKERVADTKNLSTDSSN